MLFLRFFLVLTAALVLSACGSVREDLGLGRSPPDEFAVIDRPPLSMPPDFALRPPTPGAPRPQETDPALTARGDLFASPGMQASAGLSDGEKALLQQTGADRASPDIRAVIANESADVVDTDPHLLDKLLWWKKDAQPGTTVDAEAEAARLKNAKDKGEPVNAGATPIIEKDKSGWLGL